jgi:hypothetical protein
MVWNQYVWEASTGNEADMSDGENDGNHQDTLHIDDWIDFNSEELDYLWAILHEYLYEKGGRPICFHSTNYEDFARFCYEPPFREFDTPVFELEHWIDTHNVELLYMWKLLKRTNSHLLHRTTYEDFTSFCSCSGR